MYVYLLILIAICLCFVMIDARYKLAFFAQPKRTALTLLVAMAFFVAWDISGIALGIFVEGESPFVLGLHLLPHFPIEEVGFLFLLSYMPLVLYRLLEARWPRT